MRRLIICLVFVLYACQGTPGNGQADVKPSNFPIVKRFDASEKTLVDSVELLSRLTGWAIDIDGGVSVVSDISIDMDGIIEKPLDEVLSSVVGYVNKAKKAKLAWKRVDGESRIVIYMLD